MPPKQDVPIPVEESYRALLRLKVEEAGGQHSVAAIAGIDQATISRTLRPEARATYGTLLKLCAALPGMPSPIVPIRDSEHERWCLIGSRLASEKPALFEHLLALASEALGVAPVPQTDDAIEKLKSVIANPIPKKTTRTPSGG